MRGIGTNGGAAVRTVAVVVAVLLSAVACGSSDEELPKVGTRTASEEISKDDFGDRWPFTVDAGTLRCDKGAILFIVQGTTYLIRDNDRVLRRPGENFAPIQAPNPTVGGELISVLPIVDAGHRLCGGPAAAPAGGDAPAKAACRLIDRLPSNAGIYQDAATLRSARRIAKAAAGSVIEELVFEADRMVATSVEGTRSEIQRDARTRLGGLCDSLG